MKPTSPSTGKDNLIEDLTRRVELLEEYIKGQEDQQLQYPLDYASRQIIQIDTLLIAGTQVTTGAPFTNTAYLPVTVNGQQYFLMVTS